MRAGIGLVQQDGRSRPALKATMTRPAPRTRLDERTRFDERTLTLEQSRLAHTRVVRLIVNPRELVHASQQRCERTRQALAASHQGRT